MPTSIPFDSSLVLGNLVSEAKIKALQAVEDAQKPIDTAQEQLNDIIQTKLKLDMTLQEMINLNVTATQLADFRTQMIAIEDDMAVKASAYGKAVIDQQEPIRKAKEGAHEIENIPESPIDWNKSGLKKLAISSDTMVADAQFLKNESEEDGSTAHADAVAASASVTVNSIFGPKYSAKTAGSVKTAVLKQTSKHKVAGTLVISATCTHKVADLFAPFVMDPEKAVEAWNKIHKDDAIIVTKPESLAKALDDDSATNYLSLLSGQTVGSSFVGMVHVLQEEDTSSKQSSSAVSSNLQAKMEFGGWFASSKGSFGVDSSFSDNIKNMLSTSDLNSHCSVVTMGLIPTLKSNKVTTSISQLKPDATEVMGQLSAIQSATDTDVTSVSSEANKAKSGAQFIALNNGYIKEVVSNLSEVENKDNQMIDVNSLMTAFDDYVVKAAAGDAGVPINFFIKSISKAQIAKSWMKKFSPIQSWELSSGDDNSVANTAGG